MNANLRHRREWLKRLAQGDLVAITNTHGRQLGLGQVVGIDPRLNHVTIAYPDGAKFEFSRTAGISLARNTQDMLEEPANEVATLHQRNFTRSM